MPPKKTEMDTASKIKREIAVIQSDLVNGQYKKRDQEIKNIKNKIDNLYDATRTENTVDNELNELITNYYEIVDLFFSLVYKKDPTSLLSVNDKPALVDATDFFLNVRTTIPTQFAIQAMEINLKNEENETDIVKLIEAIVHFKQSIDILHEEYNVNTSSLNDRLTKLKKKRDELWEEKQEKINALEAQHTILQKQIQELQNEKKQAVATLQTEKTKGDQERIETEKKERDLTNMLAEGTELKSKISSLKTYLLTIFNTVRTIAERFNIVVTTPTTDDYKLIFTQITNLLEKIDAQAEIQKENATLVEEQAAELETMQAKLNYCAAEKEDLRKQIDTLQTVKKTMTEKITSLTAEITERQNAPMSEVDPMLRAQEAECAELKKKKEECEAKLAEKEEEHKILESIISELQVKLSDEQQQVAKQANVIEEDKKTIEKKEKENKELEKENEKIHDKKIKLERELATATKAYKATNEEKNKLIIEKNNAQIAALEKQKELMKKLEDTEADLKNTTKQLENAIAGKKNTGIVLTLEKSIEKLKSDIVEHEKTIAETQAKLDAKIKENENDEKDWVAKIDAIQNAANDDRADLLKKNLEYNAEFEKRSALERELEELKTTTTAPSNEREINDLKQALATEEKENATLKEQLEKEKENNVRLETKYDEAYRSKYDEIMRKTKPTLMAEIDQLKAKKDALTTDITKSDNAAVLQLQKKLADLQILYEAEVSAYEKEKSKNEECESIKSTLRDDIEENKKKSAALQKEIARQNAALKVLQQQFDEKDVFAENNTTLIAEINEKDNELGKLREALARCADEKAAMDARYEQLSSTNATLEHENEKNEERLDRLKKRENDLLTELSSLFRSTTNVPQALEKERQRELEAIQDEFKLSTRERQKEYSNWHDFVAQHKNIPFIQQPSPGLFHFELPTSSEDNMLKRHIVFREPHDVSVYEPLLSGANGTHYAVVQTQSTFKNYKDFDETHFLACQIKPFAGFNTMETIFSKNNTNLIIKSTVRFTNQPAYNTLFADHAFPLVFGTPSLAFQLLWTIGYVSTSVDSFAATGTTFTSGANYAFSPTMAYAIDNRALISSGPDASQSSLHCIYLHTVSRPRVINRRRTVSTGVILPQPIQRHPICKITPEFLTKASYTPEEEQDIINYSYYMHDWYINFKDAQSSRHN